MELINVLCFSVAGPPWCVDQKDLEEAYGKELCLCQCQGLLVLMVIKFWVGILKNFKFKNFFCGGAENLTGLSGGEGSVQI